MVLWEVDIYPATGQVDRRSAEIVSDVADLGLDAQVRVVAAHGYLLEGDLSERSSRVDDISLAWSTAPKLFVVEEK